jgi:hypothetical protein
LAEGRFQYRFLQAVRLRRFGPVEIKCFRKGCPGALPVGAEKLPVVY